MKIGTDVELIAVDGNGIPRSVIGLIDGTKSNPSKTEHGWIQVDNVLVEFNSSPVDLVEGGENEFVKSVHSVLDDVSNHLAVHGLSYVALGSAEYEEEELSHPSALIAGCEPDFDIWVLAVNEKPNISSSPLRTAGGHIHVSFEGGNELAEVVPAVKAMDAFLGLPSLFLDKDQRRRSLYGKAGCFRTKEYFPGVHGIEYRSLSNFWVGNKALTEWVYKATKEAMDRRHEVEWDEDIPTIINTHSLDRAASIMNKLGIEVPCTT